MPKLGNPLVYDLLEVADILARQSGRANLQKAAMRRAISSAYYALFHALCYVCVRELNLWTKPNALLEPIYRSLDHGTVKRNLTSKQAAVIAFQVQEIGAAFALLQEKRHAADYAPPALEVRRKETLELIERAREAISLLEALPNDKRLELAILLIAKPR